MSSFSKLISSSLLSLSLAWTTSAYAMDNPSEEELTPSSNLSSRLSLEEAQPLDLLTSEKGGVQTQMRKSEAKDKPENSQLWLPDDKWLYIFSFLNQRDIPTTARVSKKFNTLINDNGLWKEFAIRAHLISKDDARKEPYKDLIKEHCTTFSFIELSASEFPNPELEWLAHNSYPLGISRDGKKSAGPSLDSTSFKQIVRWIDGGIEPLEDQNATDIDKNPFDTLENGTIWLYDVSMDSKIIAGVIAQQNPFRPCRAYRWAAKGDINFLSPLSEHKASCAYGVSADGKVTVGESCGDYKPHASAAVRWATEGGIEVLGNDGCAYGVNADGRVIVGKLGGYAVRWIEGNIIAERLPTPNHIIHSLAKRVSADAKVIAGQVSYKLPTEDFECSAVVWTSENVEGEFGTREVMVMHDLNNLLSQKGLLPYGYRLIDLNAITPSGTVLAGTGSKGNHPLARFAWRVSIPRKDLF